MKSIFVADANPAYVGFWKPQAIHMWERHGIRSILYYIAVEPDPSLFSSEYAEVKHVPMLSTVPAIVQALFAKWYFPGYEQTDERLFICDIDCFVLSRSFVNTIAQGSSIFHLKPMDHGHIPGYYVAGSPTQIRTFFRAGDISFERFCLRALNESTYIFPTLAHVSQFSVAASPDWKYFGSEEHYAGACAKIYTDQTDSTMEAPKDSETRISRDSAYNPSQLDHDDYIDYHCPRPFETFAPTIMSILKRAAI